MLLFFSTLLRLRGAGAGLTILCVSAAALAATLVPSRASACGGVFCSNTNLPIDQKAERIIFHVDASGKVTAVIEIRYEGPASKFAWLIPVAGKPTVGVSSNTVLDRLQAASNPSYTLTNTVKGECSGFGGGSRGPFSCGPIVAASATNDFASYDGGFVETDGGVNVLEQATVGPYDYVIVSVDPKLEDPGMAAGEWLSKNGYVTNDFGTDRLRPYLEGGMNLLAFRLRKGNSSGSIRPIKLEFGTGLPSIPLRPTAVAAVNNMGILVWVLGEHRAVPLNYKSLEINDALLDWTNPAASYEALVTRAANEAGGQGFVTEMASSAPAFADTLYPEAERSAWENVSRTDWNGREGALLFELLSRYAGYDGVADALAEEVVPALGVQADELIACPACHVSASVTDIAGVDAAHLLEKFRKLVVDPVADTATLFENAAKVTRLFTTMSPDEMTLDPSFA
ncbi:MAG: DUF2330 domain-containing protein, partial [Myxococcales bacterium]|nr:DUF2330 domain-containing protein [Myxococcales bacterium]